MLRLLRPRLARRTFIQAPFQDDLTAVNDDDFGLADFQLYKESEQVRQAKAKEYSGLVETRHKEKQDTQDSFADTCTRRAPLVFQSKLTDPYLNLAIEDYVYNKMPLPNKNENNNRLMLYVNSPCVVVGKNQNPWKEVNLPLLQSLQIPLVRRRSGGGTVVHDTGNINFSFMTTKEAFDRFSFAHVVANAVNRQGETRIKVNSRGDLVTAEKDLKVSGSAYKLSRGKSYHHGTMLLSSKLDVLRSLLRRDEQKLGIVDAMNSVASVSAPVTNLGLRMDVFVNNLAEEFERGYKEKDKENGSDSLEYNQDELFGFDQFFHKVDRVVIDESTNLPKDVYNTAEELKQWSWRFGNTPRFSHELTSTKWGFSIKFYVTKGMVESFELECHGTRMDSSELESAFEYLRAYVEENSLEYTGSNVAGFVTHDGISDWLGMCIDGTI